MTDEQACCACLRVRYDPIHHADGFVSERWACTSCGAAFIRRARVAPLVDELAQRAETREQVAVALEMNALALRSPTVPADVRARMDKLRREVLEPSDD